MTVAQVDGISQTNKARVSKECALWGDSVYGAFFCYALTRAHLALCAAAILRRAATDKVRFAGAVLLDFALPFVWVCVRTFAHRAL